MNTTIDRDDEETILQSGHREWAEEWERRQQDRDRQAVERFLAGRLKHKGAPLRPSAYSSPLPDIAQRRIGI
jgi:hypothetical protein